jgi:hypothetical protein
MVAYALIYSLAFTAVALTDLMAKDVKCVMIPASPLHVRMEAIVLMVMRDMCVTVLNCTWGVLVN